MEALGEFVQRDPGTIAVVGLIFLAILWLVLKRRARSQALRRAEGKRAKTPDEMPDLRPGLVKARIQIVMAMIGIAAFTFIAVMGLFQ